MVLEDDELWQLDDRDGSEVSTQKSRNIGEDDEENEADDRD